MYLRQITTIGPDLANNIIIPTKTSVYDYLISRNKKSTFLSPFDECEVISVVNGCKNKTSTDCDDINFRLIKSVITSIVKPMTHQTGTFPEKMKIAKVIPLFTSGSKYDFNNYRPISLLPQLSKILEKLYSNRLNTLTKTCDILNPCQYGFRGEMSTTRALVKVVSEITNSLNKRKHSIGVFIELQKAFDTVDHQLLCTKLELYGIRGVTYQWIRSYLSNRKQYVSYEGHKSEFLPIQCGVPQGSILGPLLFTIYDNDMCKVSKLLKFILFADDTNIFHSQLPDLVSELNTELGKMYKWFCVNKLSFNIAKTNYILFGRYTHQQDAAIIINDVTIQRVQATKVLSFLIDESLNWKNHIKMVKSKLSKVASVIYKLSHCIDQSSMRTLYCSLF